MTLTSGATPLTDTHGKVCDYLLGTPVEPNPGSVVLTDGVLGKAYQLYASDGQWHRGKQVRTWEWMLSQRNVVLVHDAPAEPPKRTMVAYCAYHKVVHYKGHLAGVCEIVLREARA